MKIGRMRRKVKMKTINYETYIPVNSMVSGKTVRRVENESGLKISQVHNGLITPETCILPAPNMVLRPGMAVKVCGINRREFEKFRKVIFTRVIDGKEVY
ncbi:MAG: hypothetical protein Athens071426_287 [Parcubacteria group bacterium Athens0714_26]|nr:MAG: hypothetical protein Athens101426_467 [Parcubacteria group bacterium Athens1014_26]TSD03128.1 MAG: hypothetical protein Athens071426_287 [Parcubacteria group bacterium Athens0714_26]